MNVSELAREMFDARAHGQPVSVPPTSRDGGLDIPTAYLVEAELTRMRRAEGHATVGRKVGFANKAMWRALKMQTLVWANMYDDTVQFAPNGEASFSLRGLRSPRIEPEVVMKLKAVPASADAAAVLEAVEWIALGFEFVDSPYPDWKFQVPDFLVSFGLHAGLVVGAPLPVESANVATLVDGLASLRVRLSKNGALVEEGLGRNSLRSPALCVGELASAIAAQPGAEPLHSGELVSTGSLTAAHPVEAGERWTVEADGLDLPLVSVSLGD
jgi:2-keto-4-pentenoate hydratase